MGRDHPSSRAARHVAVQTLQHVGRSAEAITLLESERDATDVDDQQRAVDDPEWAEDLATLLNAAGRVDDAERLRALLPATK